MTDDDIDAFYEEQKRWDDLPNRGLSLPANEEPIEDEDSMHVREISYDTWGVEG